ncbi:receptor protein kinase TMK1-like protein [Tanacetum coccineum]
MECMVKISKRARILELKRRYFEDYCSDNQYSISIKERTAIWLYFTKDHERKQDTQYAYPGMTNTPYSSHMEIKYSGRYQTWSLLQETPNTPYRILLIRRLTQLQTLLLSNNNFTSITDDSFDGMVSLQTVILDYNSFNAWQIPEHLKNASKLHVFLATSAAESGRKSYDFVSFRILLAATSKFEHVPGMNTVPESYGFQGEPLSSISNVSLLEVFTKARGLPNSLVGGKTGPLMDCSVTATTYKNLKGHWSVSMGVDMDYASHIQTIDGLVNNTPLWTSIADYEVALEEADLAKSGLK